MRKLKGIFSLLLALPLCFCACVNEGGSSQSSGANDSTGGVTEVENPYAYVNELGTVHEAEISVTDYDLCGFAMKDR